MRYLLVAVLCAASLLCAVIVQAAYPYPSLGGPTGLGNIPTAAVAPQEFFALGYNYYNAVDEDAGIKNAFPFTLTYGVGHGLEVGGVLWGQHNNSGWGINAKYGLPFRLFGSDLAVGAQYFTFDDADIRVSQGYLVGSRLLVLGQDMPMTFRVHGGVNFTSATGSLDANAVRLMAGLQATFGDKLDVAVDLQTKGSDLDANMPASMVVRYQIVRGLLVQGGISNGPLLGRDNANVFAGLLYVFDEGTGAPGFSPSTNPTPRPEPPPRETPRPEPAGPGWGF